MIRSLKEESLSAAKLIKQRSLFSMSASSVCRPSALLSSLPASRVAKAFATHPWGFCFHPQMLHILSLMLLPSFLQLLKPPSQAFEQTYVDSLSLTILF